MITAVDSSILLDIFTDDAQFRPMCLAATRVALTEGPLVACEVVWAEVVAAFDDVKAATRAMDRIPVAYSALDVRSTLTAGSAWRAYRQRGGSRDRLVADFLVGAHAMVQADRLLARDRGFQKVAFAGLNVIDPSR